MKKSVWAKMLSLALVFVCVIGLAACGGGDSSAAGSYKLQTIEMSMDLEQLAEASGVSADEMTIILDLKEDGNFSLDMSALESADMSMSGTWEGSGSSVKLTVEGETINCTLKDGVLTMAAEGVSMTFKK